MGWNMNATISSSTLLAWLLIWKEVVGNPLSVGVVIAKVASFIVLLSMAMHFGRRLLR